MTACALWIGEVAEQTEFDVGDTAVDGVMDLFFRCFAGGDAGESGVELRQIANLDQQLKFTPFGRR